MKRDLGLLGFAGFAIAIVLANVVIWGGLIWAAVHFIRKFW